jgi:hypothetical protein
MLGLCFFLFNLNPVFAVSVHDAAAIRNQNLETDHKDLEKIILAAWPNRGEPGEFFIHFESGMTGALKDLEDGNPTTLHRLIDSVIGKIPQEECKNFGKLVEKIYFQGDNRKKARELWAARQIPLQDLIATQLSKKGDVDVAKQEYARRLYGLREAADNLWSVRQANVFLSTYSYFSPPSPKSSSHYRAQVVNEFLNLGVQRDTQAKFIRQLTEDSPFWCEPPFVNEMAVAVDVAQGKRYAPPRALHSTVSDEFLAEIRKAADRELPDESMRQAFHWPDNQTKGRHEAVNLWRNKFVASLFDPTKNTAGYRPTPGEFLELLKKQGEGKRTRGADAFATLLGVFAFHDAEGNRYLESDGKKIALSHADEPDYGGARQILEMIKRHQSLESAGKTGAVFPAIERGNDGPQKDLSTIKGIDFSTQSLKIPSYRETAGAPPSRAEIELLLKLQPKDHPPPGISQDEWETQIEKSWKNRREAYLYVYGEPLPDYFPAPKPSQAAQIQTLEARLKKMEAMLEALTKDKE